MLHQLVELKRALTLAGLQLSLSLVWKVAGAVAAELGLELGEVWEDSVSSALGLAESGLDAPRPVVSGAVGLHLVAVAVRELPAPEAFAQQGLPCAVQSLASKRITSCWFSHGGLVQARSLQRSREQASHRSAPEAPRKRQPFPDSTGFPDRGHSSSPTRHFLFWHTVLL